jgi:hypothetical protein
MRCRGSLLAAVATLTLLGCGGAPAEPSAPAAPAAAAAVEWLAVTPRAYDDELAPLVAHRAAQGLRTRVLHVEDVLSGDPRGDPAVAVRAAIDLVASTGALRFVLLAGDPLDGPATVPTFVEEAPPIPGFWGDASFSSDHPFAGEGVGARAVGRLPARDEQQLATMVSKILRYEATPGGSWQRRVLVAAGPADFGPVVDALIEGEAMRLLDQRLPNDLDLELMFAQPSSPYAYRLDTFGLKMVDELGEGAFLAVYVGHGEPHALDVVSWRDRRWPIATVRELEVLGPAPGQPLFFALTCSTGAFGREPERGWGEHLVLHENGPVAVFASAHVSFPYPNFLYADALLAVFTEQRPATVGEGIVLAKRAMVKTSYPLYAAMDLLPERQTKDLHLRLYNLFGDPATRLRHPAVATVSVASDGDGALRITVTDPRRFPATARITLETERRVLRAGRTSVAELEAMPVEQAFEAMQRNHALAIDKTVGRATPQLVDGAATTRLPRPPEPGTYIVKVLVAPDDARSDVAIGHAEIVVD